MTIKSLFLSSVMLFATHTVTHAEPERIPIQIRENIRAVYQVSDDESREGVSRGLFYALKLINTYEKNGIELDQVKLHLVYHSSSIVALINDAARDRLKVDGKQNPNRKVLAELIEKGVQVEICESTMQQKGVEPDDLMPGVKIVVGAFPRLIDLQLQGYAYIKFE